MQALHLKIDGKVQGVGFRAFVLHTAQILQIYGWVKNSIDGSVYIHCEGKEADVMQLLSYCKQGPVYAKVLRITKKAVQIQHYKDFKILL